MLSGRHTTSAVSCERHTECAYYLGTAAYRELNLGPFVTRVSLVFHSIRPPR